MNWFSGTLTVIFKDDATVALHDLSFAQAQTAINGLSKQKPIKDAMYHPHPVSMEPDYAQPLVI